MSQRRVFTCADFDGHWPVGTAAVVIAESPEVAASALENELQCRGLTQRINPTQMQEIERSAAPVVKILADGDY